MGEQGKVVLRVLIGTDGAPQKVEINKSSGFDRLDRQAQDTVMRWRFVPGKRNGVPKPCGTWSPSTLFSNKPISSGVMESQFGIATSGFRATLYPGRGPCCWACRWPRGSSS
jgi:TonB family protein